MLHGVPRLFQLWACKQVMGAAGTNLAQSHYTEGHDPHCPSCTQELETCSRVLMHEDAGKVDAMARLIGWVGDWLRKVGTKPSLWDAIASHACRRGEHMMETIYLHWIP